MTLLHLELPLNRFKSFKNINSIWFPFSVPVSCWIVLICNLFLHNIKIILRHYLIHIYIRKEEDRVPGIPRQWGHCDRERCRLFWSLSLMAEVDSHSLPLSPKAFQVPMPPQLLDLDFDKTKCIKWLRRTRRSKICINSHYSVWESSCFFCCCRN